MPDMDSEDEDYLPTADLDDPVWSKDLVQDSQKYLCILEILRPATPSPQPNQGVPATLPPQHDQVKMPPDLMELNILEGIPDLLDVPEGVMSHFEVWVQRVLLNNDVNK